jgi:hypothetical protein
LIQLTGDLDWTGAAALREELRLTHLAEAGVGLPMLMT